ncbi:LPXTG cell wall anchor domain-containing protein [Streptomyces sp. NPDC050504]|uniref:LPXTG cell wall anchor domain-containing protein n=1 Tax=Streptomyces sp. NPDC050504 TaxID=3365618 RepID=UPI00379F23CF
MPIARRPLVTATAAGSLLCALWFVPTAKATVDQEASAAQRNTTTQAERRADELRLAETGEVDTTPYVIGGTALLGLGAGFVTYAIRRTPGRRAEHSA